MRTSCIYLRTILVFTLMFAAESQLNAAEDPLVFENNQIKVRLTPRTPDQMAAFYSARGFPEEMVKIVRQQCFITVVIRNQSDDILWLDTDNWRFESADGPVTRYGRPYWQKRWAELQALAPSQATFHWTLLPEALDFRPNEGEGGNIVLSRVAKPFSITANFAIGKDKKGGRVEVRFDSVRCVEDPKQ